MGLIAFVGIFLAILIRGESGVKETALIAGNGFIWSLFFLFIALNLSLFGILRVASRILIGISSAIILIELWWVFRKTFEKLS